MMFCFCIPKTWILHLKFSKQQKQSYATTHLFSNVMDPTICNHDILCYFSLRTRMNSIAVPYEVVLLVSVQQFPYTV